MSNANSAVQYVILSIGRASMFYIVGDTHGVNNVYKLERLREFITPEDFLIICGDAGIYWDGGPHDEYVQDTLLSLVPCLILWVDGNHENFDLIERLPIDYWSGGRAQFTKDRIIHLMRGEVYTIQGNTFFCFGGGQSVDKLCRTPGESWWPQEMPTKQEQDYGLHNLNKVNNEVDYIITHTAPRFICKQLVNQMYPGEEDLQFYLQDISNRVRFKKWFFGHWHMDKIIDEKYFALFNSVESIDYA